jgi:NADH-ubiquinone oxidoreductase chain 5
VALSTLRQLGVIIVALSLELKDLCFFHLVTHAIFKALLFICVGVGIHSIFGRQDFRSFSSLSTVCLWPCLFLLIANLSLLGFPFIAGFFSKDYILERFYCSNKSFLFCLIFLLGVGLTSAYSLKISYLAFFSSNNKISAGLARGGFSLILKFPLISLGFCAVSIGLFLDFTSCFNSLVILDKISPLFLILLGFLLGLL